MKKKIFALSLIAIILSMLAYGTLAYFTTSETAHNIITSATFSVSILEWADDNRTTPFPKGGISNVLPGDETTKIVEVKNTGTADAFVRIKVEKNVTLAPGVTGSPDTSVIKLDFDTTNWTKDTDGYYYYNKTLTPGTVTEPLFTHVTFDKSMGNIFQGSTVDVVVHVEAVQAANNGTSAQTALSWS